MSLFDDLDLGAGDYDKEKDPGLNQFTSKPIQRQYQPFGGPRQQTQSSIAEPQYAPPEPQPQPQPQPYHNFNDYDLDAYEQIKKKHSQISQYTRENKKSASHYGGLYDDFKKNEFTPYFESVGGFGDFETDEEYIGAIDEMYKSDLKNSQQEDGFFGASDAKLASQENLKKYASWNQPNGMRDKFLRLKAERDRRKATAEQAEAMEYALFEHMTNIPIAQREALDESLKARTAKPRSKKATDEMLNQMQFEDPGMVNPETGLRSNLNQTDPRNKIKGMVNPETGKRSKDFYAQQDRMAAAMRGDIAGFTSRRQAVAKDRQLRDKGFMFSNGGQIDGRPIGMSRKDSDLLDLEEMKKAGMTEYKGQPIEQAIESLGGEERLKVAKVMQSVYTAKSNYEDIQLEYLKNSGGAKGDALREKMEAAREEVNKTIGLASQFGLDNELFEQAETTGWLSAIGNAVKRGLLMSEMSNYTPDFLTNTLDADEMQRFIEVASEIEELPTSSTMKRVKSTKSDGFLDAMGNLLFDNPAAIPEMFVESMASFLPSAIKWMLPTAATGALAGSIIPGAGTAAGATLGARASWGAASFVLEASGMALEGMQELGIDWKNPKIFAAAWTNESIRNKIQKKMVQKGTPIAVADMLTGMMAGKVMAIANHTGNAMFKGGKLLNKTQFNKTAGAVPRFTKFQKTRNAAAELGADSLMGMSGEYLGQWASKEPGEDWDWDAIAAEGIVGVGPGVLSSALEMRSRSGNYFGNAPIEITGENMTETGSMGTVTRAGYSAPYQTFNDAESMMGHLGTLNGVSPESLEFTRSFLEQMYAAKPEEMANLKIAFSPRTPDSNMENRGTFESRDGQNLMYINEEQFAADPMGAFMHESGHFARVFILSDSELMTLWDGLGSDAQLEAYAQYFTKKPDLSFDSLPENEQKKIRRAFDRTKRTAPDVLAEEWFSYQWGRVLNEQTADKNIASKLKSFKDGILKDALAPYIGTEDLAGSTKSEKNILNARILQFLGYENGMPTPKVPDEGGKPSSTTPQTKEQTQRKLNAMPGSPQEKSKIAKAVNAMLGADILTESPSFYSNMNRAAAVAASKDIEDIEKKKEVQRTPKGLGWKKEPKAQTVKETLVKLKPKKEDLDKTRKPQVSKTEEKPTPKPEEISESPGGRELPKDLGTAPRESQNSDGLFKSKPNSKAAQKRIKRAEKKEAQKAEIRKKRDAIRKAKREETVAFTVDELTPKDYEKPIADPKFDTPAPKLGTEQDKLNQRTPSKNNTTASVNPKATSRSEQEILKLDKILPKTKEELDQIRDLKDQLSENQAKFDSVVSLDKAIGEAIRELKEEGSPSITQIISKVLNLETLLKASPISFVSEIEKSMNPTASRSKVPSSKDIEDMATEARERIEDIKELLNLRLAEIDREIASLNPLASNTKKSLTLIKRIEAESEAEITELQSKRKLVRMYLHFIAPEEASVDWKDVPHNLITFRRYKLVKGKKVYSPDTLKPIPMTFGMLASMKKWQEGSGEYSNIEYRPKNVDKDKRTPQEYLWDYVNHEFNPPPVSDKDKATVKKPFYGGLTENQYRMKLEAIKASAMFTKQQDIGKKPMGSARWEVENNIKQEKRRGYPSGFTTERGANFGAVIAERIRQKGLSGKVKSDGTKAYANFDLETLEPTITDVVALMMANGRTLELLGDPSDSMKDFDHMLFVIAREEMKSKLLGEKDKGGVPSDLENQFEYAEEDGDPFIKVQPGATLAKTLLGVLSTKARLKFERDYLDYIVENTQLGFDLEMSKEGMRLDSLSGDNPKAALEKLGEYLDSIKEKRGVDVRGKIVPVPKGVQKSLTEAYELLRARVDNEKYLSDQLNGHTIEVIGGVSKPQSKTVSKFRVKPEDVYDFRRPLSRTSENIPAKGDHGAFTAGDMYKTFDVMTAFSKRRESPELVADMIMGASTGFEKERTNVGKSETLPNNPINMDRAEADLLSSTDISAVDLANWYLGAKGSEVKRMEDLQMTPSSKDNKQLPGGLGEGLLPYVFRDFITAMYENLNIKDLDLKIKDAESDKTFDWTYTEGRMMMGGELVDFNMFTDKEGMMHPEVMEALTRPIVQAVLDAEGIDVYDQFDANSENILQRDTQKAESFDKDDSAEMQTEADETDSGAQTSKVEVNPVEQESLNQFQNDKRQELGVDPDPVNKNPVEKPITLSDLVKSNLKDKTPEEIKAFTDDSMTDSFKQAQLAENVKEFEETFTPKSSKSKNRTLNSDAGKPINDLTVIGKIIALAQKGKPVHEINRLAAQWDDDEVYFVNSIARQKSTYEGGASDADVAKKILSDLREERKSRGFPNESLGSIEEMDFNDRSIVGQAKVIDKILKNKDFLNDDADEVTLVDGFYDLAAEAEEAGSFIGDLIRKAKEIEKKGGYAEFTDAVKSKVKPRIEKAKAKGFGPMKVREVFNKENKYKYNPVELNSFIDEEFNTTSNVDSKDILDRISKLTQDEIAYEKNTPDFKLSEIKNEDWKQLKTIHEAYQKQFRKVFEEAESARIEFSEVRDWLDSPDRLKDFIRNPNEQNVNTLLEIEKGFPEFQLDYGGRFVQTVDFDNLSPMSDDELQDFTEQKAKEYYGFNNIPSKEFLDLHPDRTLNSDAGKPETGKPITLKGFHGSGQAKTVYEEGFDPGKLGSFTGAASAREGFFFARRPKTARRYSGTFGPVGRLFSKLVEVFERKTPAVSPIKDTYYSYRKAFNSSEQKEGLSMIEEKLFSSGLVNQEGKWNDRSEQKIVDKFLKSLDTIKTPKGLARKAVEVLKDEFKETQKPVADNRGLIQASLAFENPYVVDFKGKNRTYADYVKAIQKAKKDGRDGAILKNTFDPMADDIYVVFNASQISMDKLKDRTLNSDATLTSDVNPNLAKANLLSRIAGDSELKKNFEEWLKDKKDSELAGSFMMSFVDQADPLKKVHRSLFETLKAAGMDITKGPMRSLYNMLNVHGKWHQYFGKGYDTVEQARIQYIQPIKDAMLKYGIDQGTFGNYLLARAAPSRNRHLREKVKRLQKEAEGLTGVPKQTALTDIQEVYLNKDGTIKDSGISDQAAYNLITEYENNPKTGANFVNFLNEALDPYYNMNKESISMLREASMIRESAQLDGVQEGLSEYDRMVGAMSKIDLADSNSDFNFAGSKVKLSDPKYSYSPMQGFEGETEAFFDAERAWEELGKGQNSSGKGWDQPKSELLRDPAFGRVKGTRGPNPDSVLANAINQFFDSAIRSHKNEVSRSFGEMFELMRSIAYPDREEPYEPSDPELRIAYGQMSKLPEEQKKKIKEEFDEIFEQDFNETQKKNTLTFSDEYVTDGNTGEFVAKRKTLNAKFKQDPLVFVYRVNGTPMFIKFKNTTKGTRMARSMKNLKYESLPSVLKYFNKITRFMAQMFTSMNPAFIIPNFFRDLGTAFIHLTEDDKKKLVKDVFKMKNLKWITSIGKAELHISQGKDPMKELNITPTKKLKGQTEDQYAQAILKRGNKIEMYAYAKRNGAKIGYVRHDTVPELIRNIKKETGKSEGATKRRLKNVLSYVDAANTGVENSVRMSTFWAAIKNGYTPQESATMSRNITVDFNQKGELTQAFGSLYVFFGAAVNSTHRFMTTLNRRSPAEQKLLIGGIATASFVVAMFNRLMDDDEDEAVPDYDTISSYKRDTNLIMPIPAGLPGFFNDKKDTGYFSMPLPLGYNLFWSMGQIIADTAANNWGGVRGGSGVMEGAKRLLESSMNAFNPVGGASIATIGTPTFVTPIIELWANKNFMGREIRYKDDQFGVPEPGHMQDPKSTPAHWNALSKGLNEFFGGNDVIKGSLSGGFGNKNPLMYDQDSDIKFDISGNQFKHMFYGYLGGPGQLLDTAFGGLFSAAQGKASVDNVGQVPIINRFMRGTTYGSHTRELYYNLRDTVKTAEKAVKDAKKISPKAYSLVNNDLRPLLSINSQLKAFEAQKNKFSRLKSKVESASNLTEAQKLQRIADIEEKELNMMVKVIKKAQSLGIS